MAAALLLGLAVLGAAQATGSNTGLFSLNGTRAIAIGEESWIDPINDYPARAVRDGQSGIVVARLFIDRSGRVRGCLLLERPNVLALEAATCRILHRLARFRPFDGEGLATYDYRMIWDHSRLPPFPRPSFHPVH